MTESFLRSIWVVMCHDTSQGNSIFTTDAFRFRALLNNGTQEVRFERVTAD